MQAASRRARHAIEHEAEADEFVESEWLNYTALLVQVDRIVADLSAPLPDAAPTAGERDTGRES
jgi:hypothetical protein